MASFNSFSPVAPTAAGRSWWDTITGGITQISNVATQVYGVKTQLQNLKNAQAAQQQPMAQIPYIAPNAPAQYAPSTAAAPANHTMLYIGGAVVLLVGFFMMRRK